MMRIELFLWKILFRDRSQWCTNRHEVLSHPHTKQSHKQFLEYLHYAQSEMGLLKGIELPPMSEKLDVSKMRQGNLRADGVI